VEMILSFIFINGKKEKDNQKEVNLNSLKFAFFLAGLCIYQKEDYVVGW
jgi:hypothetical protein